MHDRVPGWLMTLLLCTIAAPAAADGHGLSLYDEPRYPAEFEHFDYVNPDAPKGGEIRLATVGTFDSLNQFIMRGNPATGLARVYDTLTVGSDDEPFSIYGLLAGRMELAEDRSWIRFHLREEARFHDGEPVTAEDVVFSFETLRTEGHPSFRLYYADVDRVEAEDKHQVTFHLGGGDNRELALIVGQLPVLPKHYWEEREFNRTTLDPPLGSGPYRITRVDQGRQITYERVEDYWARDLPVNRGRFNLDRMRFDYYRDMDVAVEAITAGAYDLRYENVARNWATAYDTPAVRDGRMRKVEIPHERPTGMQAFVLNTRLEKFSDPRVRKALDYAFDFENTNEAIFYGEYTRTESYFSNSELASSGPPTERELEILKPYREDLPEWVFERGYQAPRTDGDRSLRDNLRRALELLREAGWEVQDGTLVNRETGEPMRFTFLMRDQTFNRVIERYRPNLERLGIESRVRVVDDSQYQNRMNEFDFDVTVLVLPQSRSPGNEQRMYWTCEAAETPGSRNYSGICDPVVDELVEQVIRAGDRETLEHASRALDRALLAGHYVIPHWHTRIDRVIYWDRYGYPDTPSGSGFDIDLWWQIPGAAVEPVNGDG